jgi:hypothetical protein
MSDFTYTQKGSYPSCKPHMVKYLKVSTSCPKFSLTIRRKIIRCIVDPVPVSDPHHFGKLDPPDPDRDKKLDPDPHHGQKGDPDPHQSYVDSKWSRGGFVCQWSQISIHEKQDPDKVKLGFGSEHRTYRSDSDPHQSDKADSDPFDADP